MQYRFQCCPEMNPSKDVSITQQLNLCSARAFKEDYHGHHYCWCYPLGDISWLVSVIIAHWHQETKIARCYREGY